MNSKTLWAGILALSVATVAWGQPAPAAGGQGGPGGPRADMMARGRLMVARFNPYDQMVEELNLTDEQKPKLKELCDTQEKTLRDLQKQASDKMREAMDNKDDQDARRSALEESRQIYQQMQETYTKNQAAIKALLTPEQQGTWEGVKAGQSMEARFGMAQLTDDQKAKIKELAKAAGKDISTAKDDAAALEVKGKLAKKVIAEVLTDVQAAKLAGLEDSLMPGMMMGRVGLPGGPGGTRRPQGGGAGN